MKRNGRDNRRLAARYGLSLAALGLAALCWGFPVRAQEHAPPPPPAASTAPAAEHGSAPAPAGEAHANEPAHGSAPTSANPETGTSHQGPQEHGPGVQGGPQGSEHEAAQAHGDAGHGEAGHGAEGGHGNEGEDFSIHLPTWIYGPLKQLWHSGPAVLNAEGAVENGRPVDPAELKGKQVDYTYVDPHAHNAKPEQIRPTIGTIGNRTQVGTAETKTITVDGRQITLIQPTVTFVLEGLLPEGLVISLLTALGMFLVAVWLTRRVALVPRRRQALAEIIYEKLDTFIEPLIGPHYKKYVPLIGTLFIYILVMNLVGLIPGWMSPTANINVTAGLAVVIVAYTQIEGIRVNGLIGYVRHFIGEPWWLFALNVPIHIIGELAKVLSLTVRLFGNLFGEDVVIVILILLAGKFFFGAPMQIFILPLALFTSIVQAMVFSTLACVYLALMTSHEHHDEHHGAHTDDHGHIQEYLAPATPA